jgi:hypothetical protein
VGTASARSIRRLTAMLLGMGLPLVAGCDGVFGLGVSTLELDAGLTDASSDSTTTSDASGALTDARETDGTERDDGEADAAEGDACGRGLDGLQGVATACALAVSCDPGYFNVNISQCIAMNFLAAYANFGCLTQIANCNGYFACTGFRNPTVAECPTGAVGERCDPDAGNAIQCDVGQVQNCEQTAGSVCATYEDDGGSTVAGCALNASCSTANTGFLCSEDRSTLYHCENGRAYGFNCSVLHSICETAGGAGCDLNPSSAASCATPGSSCNDAGAIVRCRPDLAQVEYDCAGVGLSCVNNDGGPACAAPGCATSSCPPESCDSDGKTMHVCVGGAPYPIDCTKVGNQGFQGCAVLTETGTNTVYAYCYGGTFGPQ